MDCSCRRRPYPGSNVVDVYVRYLSEKLGQGTIETVRGMATAWPPERPEVRPAQLSAQPAAHQDGAQL